jgi:hypothetical protein
MSAAHRIHTRGRGRYEGNKELGNPEVRAVNALFGNGDIGRKFLGDVGAAAPAGLRKWEGCCVGDYHERPVFFCNAK